MKAKIKVIVSKTHSSKNGQEFDFELRFSINGNVYHIIEIDENTYIKLSLFLTTYDFTDL